jgi:hypothetical protein
VSLSAKALDPFKLKPSPSLDDLEHLPPLMLGMFGAALVIFGVVAMRESARMFSGRSTFNTVQSRIGKPPANWIH